MPGERERDARSRTLSLCLVPVPSASSPSAARATRSTPRSSPPGSRLAAGRCGDDGDDADVVLVNTCGFIDAAKKDSIDELLAAADSGAKVVAVGCLAERYGAELADALPEADAVLGFDDYADIGDRLDDVLAGRRGPRTSPRDRRKLLPISPAEPPATPTTVADVTGDCPTCRRAIAPRPARACSGAGSTAA